VVLKISFRGIEIFRLKIALADFDKNSIIDELKDVEYVPREV